MAKTLEAHDKLLREIFEGSYQFEIRTTSAPTLGRPNRRESCSMTLSRPCKTPGVLEKHWQLALAATPTS